MQFEKRIQINASPEQIFSLYKDVNGWSTWDPDVVSSSISGDFKAGITGTLQPIKGPKANITFTEITENKSFTTKAHLPLCSLVFEHEIHQVNNEVEVIHRVIFSGLLSPLFSRLIGRGIKKCLPNTLNGLKNAAESKN